MALQSKSTFFCGHPEDIREVKLLTLEEAREAIIASSKTFVQNYKDWLQFSALKQFNKCQCQNWLHPGAELGIRAP